MEKIGCDPLEQGAKIRVTIAVTDTFPRAAPHRKLSKGKLSIIYKNLKLKMDYCVDPRVPAR